MKRLLTLLSAAVLLFTGRAVAAPQPALLTDTNGLVLRSGFFATNRVALSNALALNGYLKNANDNATGLGLANTTLTGDTLLLISATNRLLALDDNGYLAALAVTRSEAGRLAGVTGGLQTNIDARSRWLSFPTNTFLTSAVTNVSLKAHGVSVLVNVTVGDLQDLASYGVFDYSVPTRVRVLRDANGYPLGSGRYYNKLTTDSRTSDGVAILLPIDVPSDASPGRWVLEGHEP